MSFYDLTVEAADGRKVSMADFKGKVVLVVNTATACGFTPQYEAIQKLYEKYHEKGLEIVDVPCNQFAGQAPETDEEIHKFCTLNYNTKFPQMKKAEVNGENAIELFKYLKGKKGFEGFGEGELALKMHSILEPIDKNYKENPEIKWNFTKFLIDKDGEVVARFEPTADMKVIEQKIKELLCN